MELSPRGDTPGSGREQVSNRLADVGAAGVRHDEHHCAKVHTAQRLQPVRPWSCLHLERRSVFLSSDTDVVHRPDAAPATRPDWREPSHVYPTTSGRRRLLVASGCMAWRRVRDAGASLSWGYCWWQVQGSNLGRLSRRFYRPLRMTPWPGYLTISAAVLGRIWGDGGCAGEVPAHSGYPATPR
jgi:hypothetical protein